VKRFKGKKTLFICFFPLAGIDRQNRGYLPDKVNQQRSLLKTAGFFAKVVYRTAVPGHRSMSTPLFRSLRQSPFQKRSHS
jgi:hypothetical protein